MINSDEALNVGHREGKSTRLMKSWLRTHRTCAGGGGFALLSGQRSPKQQKRGSCAGQSNGGKSGVCSVMRQAACGTTFFVGRDFEKGSKLL